MKMVKSLLLGSAAGLVAVAGAQAADLPVKAKPVEYVKVCSLYGAGYYYIPGTDVCLKVGGYVRAEWTYGFGSTQTNGQWGGSNGRLTRTDGDAVISTTAAGGGTGGAADTVWRVRGYVSLDSRQQTAYGTLRAYMNVGYSGDNNTVFSANRAFIQIAGFTVGRAQSYFDHYSGAAVAYLVDPSSDTGDGGQEVFAYTAQLGNGVSATLSLESPVNKRRSIGTITVGATEVATTNVAVGSGNLNGNNYGKLVAPDVVANIRINQAWGSAQIMGALHQVTAGYYGATTPTGHPSDEWGWAVGGGIRVNLPMIAPGDYIAAQVAYTQGALRYVANTSPSSPNLYGGGNELAYGFTTDGVMSATGAAATGTGIELTTAWGFAAAWEHFWTPSLRTSLHGGYHAVRYNTRANALICSAQRGALAAAAGGFVFLNAAGEAACNQNWEAWQVGSRTQWNVTKDFYMGFDVIYYKLQTANSGAVVVAGAAGAQPAAFRTLADQDGIAARVRWHRDIAP